ncbi:MAG: hypothetical protein LBS50_03015 [Prevotellaceae bacterium]|jgi:hypothetical protein|nr:hypothetical protein [Prevotellaceae bacterium]
MEVTEKYKLADGATIHAVSPADFITKLRRSSFFESDTPDETYMLEFAERYLVQNGRVVRTDTAENFVKDLRIFGYIN